MEIIIKINSHLFLVIMQLIKKGNNYKTVMKTMKLKQKINCKIIIKIVIIIIITIMLTKKKINRIRIMKNLETIMPNHKKPLNKMKFNK